MQMKTVAAMIVILLLAAGFYYLQLESRVIRLNPETITRLEKETAAQDESFVPVHTAARQTQSYNSERNVYFGDLHVHTSLSFDSYLFGNRNDLNDAYQFASGRELKTGAGEVMRLSRPLDFVALTDHAESFAIVTICKQKELSSTQQDFCDQFESPSVFFFNKLRSSALDRPPTRPSDLCESTDDCMLFENETWRLIKTAADLYNKPGEFTAFQAYEYSPVLADQGKVHRNVIFRNSHTPAHATSAYDAVTVLDLWRQLDSNCAEPCDVLTIPHNMNKMWGIAYSGRTIDDDPYTKEDWALRGRSEPLAEMFQIKGSSECAVGAGAVDEECNFEQAIPICDPGQSQACAGTNSFAREGLKKGLRLQEELGFNPLRFGLIAATDNHNGNPGDAEEWDFRGANGLFASPAQKRMTFPTASYKSGIERNPGGLAGIWAKENTRDALFNAMERRETYATSGTRIKLRFFAGQHLPLDLHPSPTALETAYEAGVPMGSILPDDTTGVRFFVWAMGDPFSAPLQKIQMIKAWVEDGETYEQVTDIACSGGSEPEGDGRCPDNGAMVDLSNCAYSSQPENAQLTTVWEDPEFNPEQPAFYYVRVLENPSCRWSTYDALRLGLAPRNDVEAVIQERAWSSPIWFKTTDGK